MKLNNLLTRLTYEVVQGTEDRIAGRVTCDTKGVVIDSVFVCIEGFLTDGHLYAEEAVRRGARTLVVEKKIPRFEGVTILKVEDTRYALALMSAAYYDYPSERMKIVGVTGTKGKTSVACLIHDILETAGYKTGLIGTIQINTGKRILANCNTTPESWLIQEYFNEMAEAGCSIAVMEVSSQGLKLQRTAGIDFEIGIFTNLGRDHIGPGEHENFNEYLNCKKQLFYQSKISIGNLDDVHYDEIFKNVDSSIITYGKAREADYRISDIETLYLPDYIGVRYQISGKADLKAQLPMPGEFNVYNSVAAFSACRELGVSETVIRERLKSVSVRGRLEQVGGLSDCTVFIDYAHNAMSLESILKTLRSCQPGRLVIVFGCGGNRSRERRFEMGETAGRLADFTVITTDNPRFEKPEEIMNDIETGIKRTSGAYIKIKSRAEAVYYALENREYKDVIVIAGKGHETYQDIEGVRSHMDDRELVKEAVLRVIKQ